MPIPLSHRNTNCVSSNPSNTVTDRLNKLLSSSGPGYTLSLCPGQKYYLTAPLAFASPYQEISTVGYPTNSKRAILVVHGKNQTTAVNGQCADCDGVELRNVQIDGARNGSPAISGGANIEMGGDNAGQVVEFVHSYDPRGWSCLHMDEGGDLSCTGATIQNNDIGPAGTSAYRQWADGISVACRDSVVKSNLVDNPTDGGIVLFGSPGTRVENNTIWVEKETLLGGINMVDVNPFGGDYGGVVVTNNTVVGGFATGTPRGSQTKGTDPEDAVVKIGIAIGPRTWFGTQYKNNVSSGAVVQDNQLTGAFSYGIAMSSATNFTVQNNILVGNTSFIGATGPNCTKGVTYPSPAPFIIDSSTVNQSSVQSDFQSVTYDNSLTCIDAPRGAYWPYDTNPDSSDGSPVGPPEQSTVHQLSTGAKVGVAFGAIGGVLLLAGATWFVWKRAVARSRVARNPTGYMRQKI